MHSTLRSIWLLVPDPFDEASIHALCSYRHGGLTPCRSPEKSLIQLTQTLMRGLDAAGQRDVREEYWQAPRWRLHQMQPKQPS